MKTKCFKSKLYLSFCLLIVASLIISCSKENDLDKSSNIAPIALFAVIPQSSTVGDELKFYDQSGDPDGSISSWLWDFGDGNSSTEPSPKYTYSSGGEYNITLTVTDNEDATSHASKNINVNLFKLLWVYDTESNISPSAPALGDDGTIFFGAQDNNVYALNPDGSLKWSFATGDRVRATPVLGDDGTLYIGSQDDNLYALDSNTGSLKWSFATGNNIFISSPALADDGTIYIGSDDANLYALNSNGALKWVFSTGSAIRSAPAIADDGTIYFGSNDANVYALDPNGTLKWNFTTGGKVELQPIIDNDGTIYAGSVDGNFYAINPDGSQKWVFETADANGINGSAAIGIDGNIYFGTKEGASGTGSIIYALTPNGTEAWKIVLDPESDTISNRILSTPTVGANGMIYIGGFNGIMYGINYADGSIKFTYEVENDPAIKFDQPIWTSVALSDDGIIYFGDYTGHMTALKVSNSGLANTPWPTQCKNLKRTGN